MEKLSIPPDFASYSVVDSTAPLYQPLDGGRGRQRGDMLDGTRFATVQWSGGRKMFNYLRDFYEAFVGRNGEPFLIDLISATSQLVEYTCLGFVSFKKIASQDGISFKVQAQLEIVPNTEDSFWPGSYINADLYMTFDEPNAVWRDYSINRRHISFYPHSGSFSSAPPANAAFGRAGSFNQFSGGDRRSDAYNQHSIITADGNITFGNSDFIIDVVCTRRLTTQVYGWCLLDNEATTAAGFYLWFIPNSIVPTNQQLVFSSSYHSPTNGDNIREVRIENTEADIGIKTRYTISRSGQWISAYRNNVRQSSAFVFYPDDIMQPVSRGFIRIGSSHQSEIGDFGPGNPATPALIDGFDGILDELYIAHGPGTGFQGLTIPPRLTPYTG